MKVLNLYAGIGGNRKLWKDVEVTAVEIDPEIAKIYQKLFPDDKVIVADAHQYLLEHYKEYEFIWSSPPCPSHSRFNFIANVQEGKSIKYPDMKLYEEIILLKTWFKGKYCVENVISYYDPLIPPVEMASHYFWTNFYIPNTKRTTRNIKRTSSCAVHIDEKEKQYGFDNLGLKGQRGQQVLNNCVDPKTGLAILNLVLNIQEPIQEGLFA